MTLLWRQCAKLRSNLWPLGLFMIDVLYDLESRKGRFQWPNRDLFGRLHTHSRAQVSLSAFPETLSIVKLERTKRILADSVSNLAKMSNSAGKDLRGRWLFGPAAVHEKFCAV